MIVQHSENEIEVKLPRAERILWLCLTLFWWILAGSTIVCSVVISIVSAPLSNSIAGSLFFISVVNLLHAFLYTRMTKSTGWFRVQYSINRDGIKKILPNGTTESGCWKDVVCAAWNLSFLGFSDGTIIKTTFLFGKIKPEQLQMVKEYIGEDSPLTAAHQNYEKHDYGWNRGIKPILMKVFLLITILSLAALAFACMGVGVPNDKTEIVIKLSTVFAIIGMTGAMAIVLPFLITTFLRGVSDRKRFIRIMREQT